MSDVRFVYAQFCDDVRQEVGNKVTLIGCYADDLVVASFPAVLSKLCVVVRCVTPLSQKFKSIDISVKLGEQSLSELSAPSDVLSETANRREGVRFQVINAVLTVSPFACEDECDVAVVAKIDGVEYRPQPLLVRRGTVQ